MTQPSRKTGWDLEVDVVVVGSGCGAMTAAIAAHDRGAQVVVLEKASRLGGVSAYSGGEVFLPAHHLMREHGLNDSAEAGLAYLRFLDGGYADRALQALLLENGREAVLYLEEKAGVRWSIVPNLPDYHHPHAPGTLASGRYLEVAPIEGRALGEWQHRTYASSPHMPPGITHAELFRWGSFSTILQWDFKFMGKRLTSDVRTLGPGMMAYLVKAALVDRSIPAHLRAPMRAILTENGAVAGIRAEREGQAFHVRARKGVVLGTGGYDWHPDLPRYYEGLPEWKSMCPPTVEGDNVITGGEIGAALAGVPNYDLGMFFGYNIPGEEHDGKPLWRASWEGGYPHAIWVNRAGKRFCDESFYRDYLPRCRAWSGTEQRHPNYPPFLIFDQSFRDKYALGTYLPGQEIPADMVARADSLRGLAEALGLDPGGLEATVARFNEPARAGLDPEFGRGRYPWAAAMVGDRSCPNPNLGPLDRPPFYGMALKPVGAGINAVGLKTGAHAEVMHVRGHPIAGLYAVGNAAAPLDTGAGYQSGLSNLRGIAWGYVAGQHAAAR